MKPIKFRPVTIQPVFPAQDEPEFKISLPAVLSALEEIESLASREIQNFANPAWDKWSKIHAKCVEARSGGGSDLFWDRDRIIRGATRLHYFQNYQSFTHVPGSKQSGTDTNGYGQGGCLPQGHTFLMRGVSVLPDDTMTLAQLSELREHGSVVCQLAYHNLFEYPLKLLLPPPELDPTYLARTTIGALGDENPYAGILPEILRREVRLDKAHFIQPLEAFRVKIRLGRTETFPTRESGYRNSGPDTATHWPGLTVILRGYLDKARL